VLRINLTRADTEAVEINERLSLPADCCGEDVVSAGEVSIRAVVERLDKGYRLSGQATGAATLRCGRCLAEFPFTFDEPFEVGLLPAASAPSEEETRLGTGDLETRFYEEPWLDLAEVAAEQLQLAVPMKPLCDESCLGLCPRCGADLNRGRCACPPSRDVRWSALLDFRPRK
jgi:uncharacterized protein